MSDKCTFAVMTAANRYYYLNGIRKEGLRQRLASVVPPRLDRQTLIPIPQGRAPSKSMYWHDKVQSSSSNLTLIICVRRRRRGFESGRRHAPLTQFLSPNLQYNIDCNFHELIMTENASTQPAHLKLANIGRREPTIGTFPGRYYYYLCK